jgi:cytochrome c oxidase assembly protein subunit 15
MTVESGNPPNSVAPWHSTLLLAGSAMTGLLIVMGGVVCVTTTGKGCPDWPGCYGRLLPPLQMDAVIEFTHRLIAALTTPVLIGAAVAGWWRTRSLRWVSRPPVIALGFLAAVVVFGALAVLYGLPPLLAVADVGSALTVLGLVVTATVVAIAQRRQPGLPDRLSFRQPFAVLTLVTLGAVFLVLVSGVVVAGQGSLTRCIGWPLLVPRLVQSDVPGWPPAARLVVATVAGLLVVVLAAQGWRARRERPALTRSALACGILFLVEAGVQLLLLASDLTVWLLLVSVVAVVGLWTMLVVTAVLAGLAGAAEVS